LSSTDLISANLRYADLRSANLSYANLISANLSSANLSSTELISVNLSSTNLIYADFNGEKLDKSPLFIYGLRYDVLITKKQFKIGCKMHKVIDLEAFDDRRILEMYGKDALEWWRIYKPIIMSLHKEHIH
jgi:hypothetical protein